MVGWLVACIDEYEREREALKAEREKEINKGKDTMGMHDARSEITGFAEPAIMAL